MAPTGGEITALVVVLQGVGQTLHNAGVSFFIFFVVYVFRRQDRFWGGGSIFTATAIWLASVPFFFVDDPEFLRMISPVIHYATAAAGLVSVSCSCLAFLPPRWFARRIQAKASRAAAPTSS